MATDKTMLDRLKEWSDEVAETYVEENTEAQAAIEALGGPDEATVLAVIEWANSANRDDILFMLAITVSEVVRRWGIEATNNTLSELLESPAVKAIGEIVHAFHIVGEGGTPDRFMAEDLDARIRETIKELETDDDTGDIVA